MKFKLNDYFGCGIFITVLRWWWNENHWSCSYVDKVMCWQWHRMDNFIPAQLTCRPHYTFPYLKTSPMGNGCGKHAATNIIYCPSHDAVHENGLCFPHCILTLFFSFITSLPLWFKICSHYMITDSAAPTNRCRNLSAALQLSRVLSSYSLLLMKLTKTYVYLMPTWNEMDDNANILLGRPTTGGILRRQWKWMSYKLLATFRSAIPFHFLSG